MVIAESPFRVRHIGLSQHALENFRGAEWSNKLLGEDVKGRYADLKQASSNWGLDQMAKVERTLLRIASFEILYLPSVPLKAAINESIELAKTFGGPDSGKFVNGILGRIAADAEIRQHPAATGEGNG